MNTFIRQIVIVRRQQVANTLILRQNETNHKHMRLLGTFPVSTRNMWLIADAFINPLVTILNLNFASAYLQYRECI